MNYRLRPFTEEDKRKALETYGEKIQYSPRYSCDTHEYRHVILPKPMIKFTPPGLLDENTWRGLGVKQSLGWEMYMRHNPEPVCLLLFHSKPLRVCPAEPQHVLLFRRLKLNAKPAPLELSIKHVNCIAGRDELDFKLKALEQGQKKLGPVRPDIKSIQNREN